MLNEKMEREPVWVCFFPPKAYVSISCVLFSVMRKDAVYTVILNVTLFGGMRCSLAQDPRYLRVSAIENGVTTTYNIKVFLNLFTLCFMLTVIDNEVSNAGIARDLMEEINSNIPL